MREMRGMEFTGVRYTASGAILNTWYVYPVVYSSDQNCPSGKRVAPKIASLQRIELADPSVRLLFGPYDMTFCPLASMGHPAWVEPLRWFVMYRTLLNYNIEGPVLERPDLDAHELVDEVRFQRIRLRRIEKREIVGEDERITAWHEEGPETLIVPVVEFVTFLRVLDNPLFYSLGYYLRCEDPRNFLVEYYKATEAIFEGLGGEKRALAALAPHGVSAQEYKRFARYCNEQSDGVFDGGRHGPKPGARMETLDPKRLWSSPKAMEVFECASCLCRSVIDGYVALRSAERAESSQLQ